MNANAYPWKHGQAETPLYNVWQAMLNRCRNPNTRRFKDYGGRGISVCERWQSFENFHADMGDRPDGMTLERKDSNGNYCPENVIWADRKAQSRNRRSLVMLTHSGETLCAAEWAERLGIKGATLRARLKSGWSVADAVTKPLGPTSHRTGGVQ